MPITNILGSDLVKSIQLGCADRVRAERDFIGSFAF